MIPQQYLLPYLVSNVVALALLAMAFRRPNWVRWGIVVLFAWASWTNARVAITDPAAYQGYGELALSEFYRRFIYGWFREHTAAMVLPIAASQLGIAAALLMNSALSRRLGAGGAIVFLAAIAPLGVGSAFPFSFTCGLAIYVMARRLELADRSTSTPDGPGAV